MKQIQRNIILEKKKLLFQIFLTYLVYKEKSSQFPIFFPNMKSPKGKNPKAFPIPHEGEGWRSDAVRDRSSSHVSWNYLATLTPTTQTTGIDWAANNELPQQESEAKCPIFAVVALNSANGISKSSRYSIKILRGSICRPCFIPPLYKVLLDMEVALGHSSFLFECFATGWRYREFLKHVDELCSGGCFERFRRWSFILFELRFFKAH